MGFIARAQLASAVSNAGGLGIIETSSGQLSEVRDEIRKMRELTDKPFGVNIAQLFVRDASIVDFVAENGVSFVTTSAGDPTKYTQALKDAGLTVFHVVPSLRGALKAVDAGVDGLVVEGNEGGGFKAPTGASTMVLLPLIASTRRRADHRRGRRVRRPFDGRRARARRRRRADGHAHGRRGGIAGARQLEAAHLHLQRGRHAAAQPQLAARVPSAADRLQRSGRERRPRGDPEARFGARPLLRRQHGGVVRVQRPGCRAHHRGAARRRHPARHGGRMRRGAARDRDARSLPDARAGRRYTRASCSSSSSSSAVSSKPLAAASATASAAALVYTASK